MNLLTRQRRWRRPAAGFAILSRACFASQGYIAVLLLLSSFAFDGIAGLPMQFVLKNQVKLSPTQLSVFGALSGAPAYVGFAFGFLRDRWRPFGKGDRGYFLVLPLLLAITCFYLAAVPFTYVRLLSTSIVQTVIGLLLGAAAYGMTTEVAQRNGMSGRLSVLLLVIPSLLGIASNAVGGHFSHTSTQQHNSFLISAFMCLPMMAMAFWMPGFVFATKKFPKSSKGDERAGAPDAVRGSATDVAPTEGTVASLLRLVRTRSIYLPAAAIFLFSFAPGWGTPLFYYLTDKVKLSEAAFSNATALSGFGFLGATLSYIFLCNKAPLKTNLIVGTSLAVIGCPLYLLIHNPLQAGRHFGYRRGFLRNRGVQLSGPPHSELPAAA